MRGCIARFEKLTPSKQAFIDTRIPEHERDIFNVIGRGVTEDAALAPAIAEARDFNLTYVGADPGKGAVLHAHPTVEVFIAMSSRWAVYWGDEGENEIILDPWDVISVPVGVMRGFRNVGEEHGHIMAILGGTDSGKSGLGQSGPRPRRRDRPVARRRRQRGRGHAVNRSRER